MKKTIAILVSLIMCVSLVAIVASADDPVNVAATSTYEIFDIYQQQKESPWGWSDNPADAVYGDETGKDLIDGQHAADVGHGDPQWVGMSTAHPQAAEHGVYLLFTLDQAYDVGTIVVTVNNSCASGIAAPSVIEAFYSEDGTEFKGGYEGGYTAELVEGTSAEYRITLNKHTQYVKLVYTAGAGTWMFTDEVEIYNDGVISDEPEEPSEEPSAEPSEEPSEEPEASSEAPAEPSEEPEASSEAPESTTEDSSEAPATDDAAFPWWIIVVAVAVVAIVVVVVIVSKKKK